MAFHTITSTNATLFLTIASVYPNGIQIFGFSVDDAFVAEPSDTAETQIGVDGYGVMGYRPREVALLIRIFPVSPSITVFEDWYGAQDQIQDMLPCSAIITMPSAGRKYVASYGALQRVSSMAEVRRVLASREFRINFLPQGPGIPAIQAAPM